MYQFQVSANTQTGESIAIVGSTPELGLWDITKCVHLRTSGDRYPKWWTDKKIDIQPSKELGASQRLEYKYVRLDAKGRGEWEALGSNRWLPLKEQEQNSTIVVDDGVFGYLQPYPFGYIEEPAVRKPLEEGFLGLKIVVIGSSVADGHKAWLLKGWVKLLEETLQEKYGHRVVNVSEVGANVTRTIDRFAEVVTKEQPDIVIIALSLGNEGLAYCPPHERRAIQRRFESGLLTLVKMTRALGARPILGGVYPNGAYSPEHYFLLKDTHNRMLNWDVPILNWLAAVDNGDGRWREGISFDPSHPNTMGHRLMYQAIDLNLFQIDKNELAVEKQRFFSPNEIPIYRDNAGFYIGACIEEKRLRISNPSKYTYTIAPYWQELQTVLQSKAGLIPGIYIAKNPQKGTLPYFAVQAQGAISTTVEIPPGADLEYSAAFNLFAPNNSQVLFYDGHLGILQNDARHLWVINESDHEYNIHPMWKEVRLALKAMPAGVYEDPLYPDIPFRTMMIGNQGLESRVKLPPQSAVLFQYKCKLSDISRVAIVPLGDRCAVRMMLYKMEYDGPAFPFDLTRTTNIADIADIIENRFYDIWNPSFLHYNPDAGRIYHSKWGGLSFAHEVEDTDDPTSDMSPVHERMRVRYTARSERFWYTIQNCDKALFVRTGIADRGGVIDLVNKLEKECSSKLFQLLLLSPQASDEFSNLPNVLHYNVEFNPDLMYDDLGHWMYCTEVMRGILESLGISSKNLFWCPPNPPKV
ncbi:glycoside hydrolase, starch-binding protein [Calothrix sp. NIES-4071]|nr:glycoside hydrolase, starch-binding protein [Calothrix sp. NIES-4071]BAZ62199.1 glycoside hydrolase, starch-binding protein [Calothrix sp. NIES-4105]